MGERGIAEGPVTGFIAGTGTRQRRPHDTREGQEDADDDLHNSIFKTGSEGVEKPKKVKKQNMARIERIKGRIRKIKNRNLKKSTKHINKIKQKKRIHTR